MSDIQRMVGSWLKGYGFSVGIGDCVISRESDDSMRDNIDAALCHVDSITRNIPRSGSSIPHHEVEGTVSSILNRVTMQVGGHISSIMSYRNALV